MTVVRSQGALRPEVARVDELPLGVQAPIEVPARPERTATGQWLPGTRTAQSKGGKALVNRARLASSLGLGRLAKDAAFRPYRDEAETLARAHSAELAANVGGGRIGPGPSSLISSACLQLGWSRFLSDRAALTGETDDILAASRLADASRQNLLAAHELAGREAQARPKPSKFAALAAATAAQKEPTR